jgi:hypothetical protein
LLFSETDVYDRQKFFKTEYGRAILSDYKRNKQTKLGIGCQSLVGRGLCALKLANPSIEDLGQLQALCTGCYSKRPENQGGGLGYLIKSPRNYFNLARRKIAFETTVITFE